MGKIRQPTALIKLNSEYRACHHGDRSREPQPIGTPTKPPGMSGHASAHWDFLVPHLVADGVAKAIDGPALIRLCEYWAEYERAFKIRKKDRNRLMQMTMAFTQWQLLAKQFGLTPSARASIVSDAINKKRTATASHLA